MRGILAALLLALPLCGAGPKITYTRSFPGSQPPYFCITVDRSGALAYKESPTDDHPVTAQLPESDTAVLFDLAAKLNYFKTPLESGLKVANTGKKTFRYENGSEPASEATFNYSVNPAAQDLLARFENIAATEQAYIDLDRTVHFDKLGVNDSLAEIESLWLKNQLAAPKQFLPLLNRIASHESYMHLVRERAARLKEEFESGVPPGAAVGQKK
jgi:hypothetical protein